MTAEPEGFRELSGRELAKEVRAAVAARAAELTSDGRQPRLAVVTANDDGGSAAYVRSISAAAAREGIACDVVRTTTATGITATLTSLADDPEVHGIILQTPLPEGASLAALATLIPVQKDVDGARASLADAPHLDLARVPAWVRDAVQPLLREESLRPLLGH